MMTVWQLQLNSEIGLPEDCKTTAQEVMALRICTYDGKFSKKATKFEAIFHMIWRLLSTYMSNQVGDCFKSLLPFQNVPKITYEAAPSLKQLLVCNCSYLFSFLLTRNIKLTPKLDFLLNSFYIFFLHLDFFEIK